MVTASEADIVVSKTSGGGAVATRNGSQFSSGSDEDVLHDVQSNVQSGDTVLMEDGEYVTSTMKFLYQKSDILWSNKGYWRLDDGGSDVKAVFRIDQCENVEVTGEGTGVFDMDKENNVDDGDFGTQFAISIRNSTGVEVHDCSILNAFNGFLGGNQVSDIYHHHNYMETSDERGIYHSGGSTGIEIGNNELRDVRSGAYRSNEAIDDWYIHDNSTYMRDGFGPVYLFEGGCQNITIETSTQRTPEVVASGGRTTSTPTATHRTS